MPPKKKTKKEETVDLLCQPARTFAFTLSPPTDSDNGDEIVLKMTEDGVPSVWKTWIYDEDLSTAYHPEDMVILLSRGDFTLLTSDSDYYPRDPDSNKLAWIDGEEKLCFYLQDDDDEEKEDTEVAAAEGP